MNKLLNNKSAPADGIMSSEITGTKTIMKNKVNLLWTGGFDSTFRMVQLSMLDVDVQPYYIFDKRTSENYELNAINSILRDIQEHPKTKCHILPLIKFSTTELDADESVFQAYDRLFNRYTIGIQYEWLGRFSNVVPGIELSVERSEMGRVYNCLQQNGKFIRVDNGVVSYYIVDKENSSPDLVKVFGNFHFPHPLFATTKLQMVDIYKEWGYEQVMLKTWFCHTPIKNRPCGLCTPCMAIMMEGLSFRIPASGIQRFHIKQKYGDALWFKRLMKYYLKIATVY